MHISKEKKEENNLKSRTEAAVAWAAIPRVYQTLKLTERCFFPEVVWQLIPSFWSIVYKRVQSIPGSLDCWYMCCIAVPKFIFIIF
jgi:hypothetical protein